MDRADYEDIAGRLHGLVIRLDDRLPGEEIKLITEFIDAGELGLALEQMADVLSEDEQPWPREAYDAGVISTETGTMGC